MDHTTIDGLKNWYAKKFEMYGWLLLAKEHGNLYKILNFNSSVKQLYHDIEHRLKTVHDKDNKKDLEIMLQNLEVLCKAMKKDHNLRARSVSPVRSKSPVRSRSPVRSKSPVRAKPKPKAKSPKAKSPKARTLKAKPVYLNEFSDAKIKEALAQLDKGLKGKSENKTNINKLLMELRTKHKFSKYIIAKPPTHDINDIVNAYVYHYLDNNRSPLSKSKSPVKSKSLSLSLSSPVKKSKSLSLSLSSPVKKSKSKSKSPSLLLSTKSPVKKSKSGSIKENNEFKNIMMEVIKNGLL